ncbi:RsbRD N-terminal domain-containing protein [Desulforhopalus singaporensis]|uniref:RsbT co-antagonist protein rsbRD N-terminal domain-containing protein n=1 Tax=Desulforhopalus singaporensis TaxID=91360 RepID=A0A1H0NBK4_9BACT|nr:RsbRD N-terminal domain-containing protein [Desulforhopalus singaporensis]SDO90129.1 RsbT co-antagonist protein rsbRD N-terminal domain-containing protein [Desulforhopalus singaporensis]
MDLAEGFRNHKEKIINKWVEYTLSSYGSSKFFKKERDQFANPVGGNTREALTALFSLLAKGEDSQQFKKPLEQLLAIRAVQEFSPSQAVAPLNAVKHITREVFKADKERRHLVDELYDFDFAVDLAVLAAFDIYMRFRERLYKVRIDEIRSGNHVLTDAKCPSNLLSEKNK